MRYDCIQMLGATTFQVVADAVQSGATSASVTCSVTAGGTYLIAVTPLTDVTGTPDDGSGQTSSGELSFTAPAGTTPYGFLMTFKGMDYGLMINNQTRRDAFRLAVRQNVGRFVGLDVAHIQVGALSNGSVKAEVIFHAPSNFTAAQVNAIAAAILANPMAVFDDSFIQTWGVTGIDVTLDTATPLPAEGSSGLSPGAQAGIAIGVIVFVLACCGGGYYYWQRKRRMAAQAPPAFDSMGPAAVYGAPAGGAAV